MLRQLRASRPSLTTETRYSLSQCVYAEKPCTVQKQKQKFQAKVSPTFKKVDKTSAANYRPISLTCILCKVLEHILASHLVNHFDKHDLLYDLQHKFREKRSCDTQLTMLFEDLARNTSVGKQTDLILLDF